MKHSFLVLLFIVLTTTACGQSSTPVPQPILSTVSSSDEQLLRDIGEMLLVGFRGTTLNETNHIIRDIQQYHIGGVILFEYDAPTGTRHRNVQSPLQLRNLCADLQKYADGHLLIGIDQEGGNVVRMRARDGFPATKSAQATAQGGDDSVTRYAALIADQLHAAGLNLNFAPCVDVNINPSCPVIGKLGRSFSADPTTVTHCATLWLNQLHRKHVIGCLKHFPGHGSASGDTHAGLVDVTKTWQDKELQPYRTLIDKGIVDMVMVAHVINRNLGDDLPASLSPSIVKEILRTQLGFDGVIVTDDLAMGAIARHYGFEETLRMAIQAGCDLLCLSNNGNSYDADVVPRAVQTIFRLVKDGTLSADQIHASAERIRTLKKKYQLN